MSRPALFEGLGAKFVGGFGNRETCTITLLDGTVREKVPCIFREFREDGLAELDGPAVEGVTHSLKIASSDAAGIEQDVTLVIASTSQNFEVAGVTHDGRAMHRLLLREI